MIVTRCSPATTSRTPALLLIRTERDSDIPAIRAVHASAFETSAEANLVDLLRAQASPLISLVAERHDTVIGHILFSPVRVASKPGPTASKHLGLAPLAVIPNEQGRGIGSALVGAGLEHCKRSGCVAVVVLGHAGYYSRFGFSTATRFGLRCEYDASEDAFMAIELAPDALRGASGMVKYHAAFGLL